MQTSVETGVPTRTISRWLKKGWLRRPPPILVEAAPQDALVRSDDQEWTARSLLDLGMDPDVVDSVLHLVEDKAAVGGQRWRKWLSSYVPLAAKIPQEWVAAIAFLPILGRDLCSPTWEELATLMYESAPWGSKQLRSRYASEADPLLANIRAECKDWLLFVTPSETEGGGPVVEAGVVWEVFVRCPHVDRPVRKRRPRGKEFKKFGLHRLARSRWARSPWSGASAWTESLGGSQHMQNTLGSTRGPVRTRET